MTRTGFRSFGIILIAFVAGLAAPLGGCAGLGPVAPIAVTDIKTVAGTWQGTIYPHSEPDPYSVTLTIREDGSYDVLTTRAPIGTSRGSGKIVIRNGLLILEGQRGRGVGTVLRDSTGTLLMEVDATLSDNSTLTAKLSRGK